jgi:hypothetical protein
VKFSVSSVCEYKKKCIREAAFELKKKRKEMEKDDTDM